MPSPDRPPGPDDPPATALGVDPGALWHGSDRGIASTRRLNFIFGLLFVGVAAVIPLAWAAAPERLAAQAIGFGVCATVGGALWGSAWLMHPRRRSARSLKVAGLLGVGTMGLLATAMLVGVATQVVCSLLGVESAPPRSRLIGGGIGILAFWAWVMYAGVFGNLGVWRAGRRLAIQRVPADQTATTMPWPGGPPPPSNSSSLNSHSNS